ncbi:MAG: phage terminase large subunit family protein [Actinomycetia bacterium]|nr:phage terminase large subunit family protein [Actinomycetes bacterium]
MTYSEWIVANTKLHSRPFSYEGYEFQAAIADDMSRDLTVIKPSQVGMALALDTPIVTPSGWTTMGRLQIGDTVFDELGQPCKVTYTSPVYTDHDCYEVEFDTGEVIVADAGHRWYVEAHRAFGPDGLFMGRGRIPANSDYVNKGVITTSLMAKTFKVGNRNNYAIPVTAPLAYDKADLPLDPYVLGLWLGDGNLHSTTITCHESDRSNLEQNLATRGYICILSSEKDGTVQLRIKPNDQEDCRANRVFSSLVKLELQAKGKFIPLPYLKASRAQRLELLKGLMDSDGSITDSGRASFYNTDPFLVADVAELLHSLGFKTRTRWRKPAKSEGRIQSKKTIAEVSFVAYSDTPVFGLSRKFCRQPDREASRHTEVGRRRVVDVRKIDPLPVRCIQVDSPNHLFLAGRGMIPTHNTEVQVRKFLAILARNRGHNGIFTFPNEKMYRKNSKTRIKPIVQQPAFNSGFMDDEKPTRAMDLYEINGSFAFITGLTEGDATSTPADVLFHDELDLSDPAMIGLMQSRLQNSKMRITQKFSTPTHPGFGIDASFQASDQRHYMVRCEACNHYQDPLFNLDFLHLQDFRGPEKLDECDPDTIGGIDFDRSYVKCVRCSRPLNLRDPSLREWVAKHPARIASGYRITPFSPTHGRLDIRYIFGQLLKMKQLDNLKGWYNTVLGETYSDGNSKLEPAHIEAIMGPAGAPDVSGDVILGCDMGTSCHLTLGRLALDGRIEVFHFEQVPSSMIEERILELDAIYNIVAGATDRFPYTTESDRIRNATEGRIVPIEYRGADFMRLVKDEYGRIDHVSVNRTQAIDAQVRAVLRQETRLVGYGSLKSVITEHMCDMVRVERDEKAPVWEKLTGNDHFMHSLVLMRAAARARDLILANTLTENRSLIGILPVRAPVTTKLGGLNGRTFL